VLMRSQPSWRVAPIDDETAGRLRPLAWALAGLSFAAILLNGFNAAIGASRAAGIATQAALALLHLLLIGAFLLALARIRAGRSEGAPAASDGLGSDGLGRAGLGLVELIAWLAVLVAVASLSIGYIGLAYAIVQFMAWGTLLGSATYILAKALDDMLTTLFRRDGRFGQMLVRGVGLRGSSVDQIGLLLSGVARAVLLVAALGMLVSPFGAGGGLATLFGRLGSLAQGVQVGGVSISPGTILRGLAVLLIGLALVRAFMGWLENRYLPVTDLDGSGRNSVSLVARYVGIALAVIWSLASLGVGVERIALLLSALSVGIGFGLQAITSNFVSGLILLAERRERPDHRQRDADIARDQADRVAPRSIEVGHR
ncbi:MAG: mechanosensitive ion channel, partial [Sphingomonas sp.]